MINRFHCVALQNEDGLMEYFEAVMKTTKREPRNVIGWVTNELLGHLKQQDMSVSQRWEAHWQITLYYIDNNHRSDWLVTWKWLVSSGCDRRNNENVHR